MPPIPRQAAHALRDAINSARKAITKQKAPNAALIKGLYEAGCIRFGEFTMASGMASPIYVDLRRVVSDPALFKRVVTAYAELLEPLSYDLIAAVPYAALPAGAALALHLHRATDLSRAKRPRPMARVAHRGLVRGRADCRCDRGCGHQRRQPAQSHRPMEAEALRVKDVAVLVDREQGGGKRLAAPAIGCTPCSPSRELLDGLLSQGCIAQAEYDRAQAYFAEQST